MSPPHYALPASHTVTAQVPASVAEQRLILLLGSPRSGTTWLAKILDTYEGVLYLHEPFRKIRDAAPGSALRRIADGEPIAPEERESVLAEIAQFQARCVRPPFFPKRFRACPPWLLQMAWVISGSGRWGQALFRSLNDTPLSASYDLLLKEVDWHPELSRMDGLDPQHLIIIIRHPCAVVCSRLNGIRLGVMPEHNRDAWLSLNRERVRAAGFTAREVAGMSLCAFYALDWLLENQEYRAMATRHPRCATVKFEELCRDPLRIAGDLFSWLDWKLGPRTQRFIRNSGSGSWPAALLNRALQRNSYFGIYRDSEAEPGKWRALLTSTEVDEILGIARSFPVADWPA